MRDWQCSNRISVYSSSALPSLDQSSVRRPSLDARHGETDDAHRQKIAGLRLQAKWRGVCNLQILPTVY